MKIVTAIKNILKSIYLIKGIYFFLIITILLSVGCNNKQQVENEILTEIIDKDTIVLMLMDIHIADSYLSINPTAGKDKIKAVDFYYSIFDKYGYTKEQFKYSVDYYSKQPQEFEKMYEKVLNKLKAINVDL